MPKAEAGGAAEIIRRVDLKSKKKKLYNMQQFSQRICKLILGTEEQRDDIRYLVHRTKS
jgi:hypothetical protein